MRVVMASVVVLGLLAGFGLASGQVGVGEGGIWSAKGGGDCAAAGSACDVTSALLLAAVAEDDAAACDAGACDSEKKAADCDKEDCDKEKKAGDCDKEDCDKEKAAVAIAAAGACDACDAAAESSCPSDCEKACCTESAEKEDCDVAPALKHVMKDIEGNEVALSDYQGKVLLMVNVASECGYTRHYAGLQELHEKYAEQGLVVMGFPCNQFGGQEPGSDEQIAAFCEAEYGVTFPMFSKIDVNGEEASPLFQYLTSEERELADTGEVQWNFEKFLIDREGNLIERFRSRAEPTGEQMVQAIEKALEG